MTGSPRHGERGQVERGIGNLNTRTSHLENVAAIVLAAGQSRRLGQPKQLIEFRGRPLVVHAIHQAVDAGCDPMIVVTGACGDRVEAIVKDTGAVIARNVDWATGQGTSVSAGMETLMRIDPLPVAVLIMVCDQPLVRVDHLRTLIHSVVVGGAEIAATEFEGDVGGVPACFSRSCFGELKQLRGSAGARSLIRESGPNGQRYPCRNASKDIDTPEDLSIVTARQRQ